MTASYDALGKNQLPTSSTATQSKLEVILGKMMFVEGASTSRLAGCIDWLIKDESIYGQGVNYLDIGFRTAQAFKPLGANNSVEIKRGYDTQIYHTSMSTNLQLKSVMWLDDLQHSELFTQADIYEMFVAKLLNRCRQTINTFGYVVMLKLFADVAGDKLSKLSDCFKLYAKMYDEEFPDASNEFMKEVKKFNTDFKNKAEMPVRPPKSGNMKYSPVEQRNIDLIDFSVFIKRRINMLCVKVPMVENTWTWEKTTGESKNSFASNTTPDQLVVIMSYEDHADLMSMVMVNVGFYDPMSRSIVSPESWGVLKVIPLEGMASGTATIIHKDAIALMPRFEKVENQRWIETATTQYVVHKWFRFGVNKNLPGVKVIMKDMKSADDIWVPPST